MPAAITDKARKSYSLLQKTLNGSITDSDTTITLNNVTNIPTDTAVDVIIDRIDSNGDRTTGNVREIVKGVVSGSTLINCERGLHGTTAQSHASGAVVELIASGVAWNDLIDLVLADHSQAGAHEIATNYDPSNPTLETQKWAGVASAVNEITVTNAATGNFPTISATGEADTGIDFENSEGEEILKLDAVASAVNEVTIKNATTGNPPSIEASGGDTNTHIKILGKGTGGVLNKIIACRAYKSSAQNLTGGGGEEKVQLDAESYDIGSNYDTTNHRFVAPVTGYYQVNVCLAMTDVTDASNVIAFIYVNGAAYSIANQYASNAANNQDPRVDLSDLVYCEAGQYIELYGDCTTTEPVTTGATSTFMSIYLVGVAS